MNMMVYAVIERRTRGVFTFTETQLPVYLTPWSRVILEKLTVAHLVKE